MSTASEPIPRTTSPDVARGVLIRLGQIAAGLGLEALILFVGAGRLDWIWRGCFLASTW
jgi:hypothetical protein